MKKKRLLMGLVALSAITGVSTMVACNEPTSEVVTQQYTVTFVTNGGSTVNSVTVNANGTLPSITAPTRDGYTFDGWYTNANFTGDAVTISSYKVTANVTLYAKWSQEAATYTVTFNTQVDGLTVASATTSAAGKVATPSTPTRDGYYLVGWYTTEACTGTAVDFATHTFTADTTLYAKWSQGAPTSYTLTFMLDENTLFEVVKIEAETAGEGETVFISSDPTKEVKKDYYKFAGWYTEKECINQFTIGTLISQNTVLYAKWDAIYENVTTEVKATDVKTSTTGLSYKRFNFSALEVETGKDGSIYDGEAATTAAGLIASSPIESFSKQNVIKVGTDIEVTFAAAATFEIVIASGGSSTSFDLFGTTKTLVGKTDHADYSKMYIKHTVTVEEAGTYTIKFAGNVRIASMKITESLQTGPIENITANVANNENLVLIGREYSTDGLMINVEYANGRVDSVYPSDCKITHAIDKTTAGKYPVTVNYSKSGTTYTCTYDVEVLVPESISIFDHIQSDPTVMNSLLKVYKLNEEIKYDNLSVVLYATSSTGEAVSFLGKAGEYALTEGVTTATSGVKTIQVSTPLNEEAAVKSFNIIVLDANVSVSEVTVDDSYTTDYSYDSETQTLSFKTITAAYQYLSTLSADTQKVMNIKNGTYNEKLYLDIPNLSIIGESEAGVIIEEGYYSGMQDAKGNVYSTRGSATVFVTANALNFSLSNITIKNSMDTSKEYWETREKSSNTQAVALYTAAKNGLYKNCSFMGYHDTLEIDYNNNYFEDCYISGRTDYIFGYSAQAYFNNCEIHTVVAYSGKDSTKVEANGGYIIATNPITALTDKNYNEDYAFVFNNCKFTADEEVIDGSVALARVWGATSRVVIANSEIGSHVAVNGFTGVEDSCARYCTMSGNKPGEGSNFIECNNTGAGAISASQSYGEGAAAVTTVTYYATADETVNSYINLGQFYDEWIFDNSLQATYELSFEGICENADDLAKINTYLSNLTMTQWGASFTLPDFEFAGYLVKAVYTDSQKQNALEAVDGVYTYQMTAAETGKQQQGLYVEFEESKVNLTYDAGQGGTVGSGQTQLTILTKGDPKAKLEAVASRDGYNFEYWTATAPDANGLHTTAPEQYVVDSKTGITVDTLTLYAYYTQKASSAIFKAEDLGVTEFKVSTTATTNIASNDYISLDLPTTGKQLAVSTVIGQTLANDKSGLEFTKALVPSGGTNVAKTPAYTITAKSNISITIYFTMTDSKFLSVANYAKSGGLVIDEVTVTDTSNKENTTAYTYTMSLTAGQTINLRSSSNRLVLFGVYAEAASTTTE